MADELGVWLGRFRGRPELAALLDRALWRKSQIEGFYVLMHKPAGYVEQGDKQAHAEEPPPQPAQHAAPMWWEQPYPGGPMVAVKGFPRALYPPDAGGYPTSADGPDVIAYKRTISRGGRWPWATGGFDDTFSNAFSHGKPGGNVGDSGVAGTQRQGKISPDTGYVGQGTFNLLRSIRIPDGLPNVGQPAMDGVAVNLINEAWQKYKGKPPQGIDSVKDAIAEYLKDSIDWAGIWHYSQARPISNFGTPPWSQQTADCSGQSTSSYYWAKQQTGVAVPDPNKGNGYNGYGYTGTLINNPKVGAPYQIGDLGLYGDSEWDTSHVVTCMVEGGVNTAEWCSNGSEGAPSPVELHYRSDYLCVVRPGLMP